jgi:hypothetical protein
MLTASKARLLTDEIGLPKSKKVRIYTKIYIWLKLRYILRKIRNRAKNGYSHYTIEFLYCRENTGKIVIKKLQELGFRVIDLDWIIWHHEIHW